MDLHDNELRKLDEFVEEWNKSHGVLNLQDIAAIQVADFSSSVRKEYLPAKFLNPTYALLLNLITSYAEMNLSRNFGYYNIFYQLPVKTLELFQEVSNAVVSLNKPTVYPEKSVGRLITIEQEHAVDNIVQKIRISQRDKNIFKWWFIASSDWWASEKQSFETNLQVLKTLLCLVYDIKLDGIFQNKYIRSKYSPQELAMRGHPGRSSGVESNILQEDDDDEIGKIVYNDDARSLPGNMANFMLVSALADMIGKPERHVFSIDCKCWVCIMSSKQLTMIHSPLDLQIHTQWGDYGEFVYIASGFIEEIIPRFKLLGPYLMDGVVPLFISKQGYVKLADYSYVDALIDWTIKHVPPKGGVMYLFNSDIVTSSEILMFFKDIIRSAIISEWVWSNQRFRNKDIYICDCTTVHDALNE